MSPTADHPQQLPSDDVSMADGSGAVPDTFVDEEEDAPCVQRVRILPGSTETAASFEFLDEGHTLGNVLRYIIMKNPDVEFCAYAIPHPSEAKMNIRIQTYEKPAVDALRKGLADIQILCNAVADEFCKASNEYCDKHDVPRRR